MFARFSLMCVDSLYISGASRKPPVCFCFFSEIVKQGYSLFFVTGIHGLLPSHGIHRTYGMLSGAWGA